MQFPVTVQLHRSKSLLILLVLFHAIAIGSFISLPWPWYTRGLLLLLVGFSAIRSMRAPSVVGLRLTGRETLDCLLYDGSFVTLVVKLDSTVFRQLVVLRLCTGEEKQVRNLALLPDQMSADQFRLLRIWLRWRVEPKERSGFSV